MTRGPNRSRAPRKRGGRGVGRGSGATEKGRTRSSKRCRALRKRGGHGVRNGVGRYANGEDTESETVSGAANGEDTESETVSGATQTGRTRSPKPCRALRKWGGNGGGRPAPSVVQQG